MTKSLSKNKSSIDVGGDLKVKFIKEFCNDHNGKIRWLRGVALNEKDLLSQILKFFDEQ